MPAISLLPRLSKHRELISRRCGDHHVCGIEFSPLLEGVSYSRDHFQRFKNAIYDIGLDLGGSCYRFGGVMKPYLRRMFGDEMVNRHRAMKQALDPSFILNRDVVFDPPGAGNEASPQTASDDEPAVRESSLRRLQKMSR